MIYPISLEGNSEVPDATGTINLLRGDLQRVLFLSKTSGYGERIAMAHFAQDDAEGFSVARTYWVCFSYEGFATDGGERTHRAKTKEKAISEQLAWLNRNCKRNAKATFPGFTLERHWDKGQFMSKDSTVEMVQRLWALFGANGMKRQKPEAVLDRLGFQCRFSPPELMPASPGDALPVFGTKELEAEIGGFTDWRKALSL